MTWSARWEMLHRGVDAYSLVLGGGTGLLVGCLIFPPVNAGAGELTLWLDRFIAGQLPVWVTSLFLLLRLGFLIQSDVMDADARGVVSLASHVLACLLAALAGWAICLPASVAGYWLGIAVQPDFHDLRFIDDWISAASFYSMASAGVRVCLVGVLLGLGSWFERVWLDARARAMGRHDPSQAIIRSVLMGLVMLLAMEFAAFWLVY